MDWLTTTLSIKTSGQGLHSFTDEINAKIEQWSVTQGIFLAEHRHRGQSRKVLLRVLKVQ